MATFEYRDGRFWRDGFPFFLIASDYQFYRDRQANWEDRLRTLIDAGVNCITFYIPWRHHLCMDEGSVSYDFTGRTKDSRDVVSFMKLVESLGLLMIAKPGPFVHSELNVGGLPDLVSPTFNPEVPPVRRHRGQPVVWCYDATQLPAPFDPSFDAMVKDWLGAVHEILVPHTSPHGSLIAIQLNDETVYCTSNDPPWSNGYEPSGMKHFHGLLTERYGNIESYNRLHGTNYGSLSFVPGPELRPLPDAIPNQPQSRESLLAYIDWADYQWRYRRDIYVRYEQYLNIDLPYLTNYAGITPPIQENIPDLQEQPDEHVPDDYTQLYPEWWFAMNRIESDADVYEYGMISWLGVAAYDSDVFDRYINTARRARGINMEENWGFGMLYDAKSRCPAIPFFQTLVSIAGGATGYDIYCGVSTDYWDDSLDRITKKQCPTFPSDAPIDEHGQCRPMYFTAKMLNEWFVANGKALLDCTIDTDVGYLLYAPYAAVSSWIPDERYWHIQDHAIPRCGFDGFEDFSRTLQQAGYSFGMFQLESASDAQLESCKALAIRSAFFMDAAAQQRLVQYIQHGGRLFISGELPTMDLSWQPCTLLKDAIQDADNGGNQQVFYRTSNFLSGTSFPDLLHKQGLTPAVRHSAGMRAYVHQGNDDLFVFFFNFDQAGTHDKWIECLGHRIDLTLGSKTSGVLRIRGGQLAAYMVKGKNEVENIESNIEIRFGDQVIREKGDFSVNRV